MPVRQAEKQLALMCGTYFASTSYKILLAELACAIKVPLNSQCCWDRS